VAAAVFGSVAVLLARSKSFCCGKQSFHHIPLDQGIPPKACPQASLADPAVNLTGTDTGPAKLPTTSS